jgi:hypothetical protein
MIALFLRSIIELGTAFALSNKRLDDLASKKNAFGFFGAKAF